MRPKARLLLLILVILSALSVAVIPASAEVTYRVVGLVSPDYLNVRAGPSTSFEVIGTFPPGAEGIRSAGGCSGNWCLVTDGSITGWANMRFLEEASDADAAADRAQESATHAVLPDGTLEIRFADGRVRQQLPSGQMVVIEADGTRRSFAFVQAPGAGLPPLPAELSGWGIRVNERLGSILVNILSEPEMQAYQQTEVGKTLDETVVWRLRSIEFLTGSN